MARHTILGLAASELALNDAGYSKDVLEMLTDTERQRMVGMSCCVVSCCMVMLLPLNEQ